MICAWKQLLTVLPPEIGTQVDSSGRETMQALRLRLNAPPEMVTGAGSVWLTGTVKKEHLNYVINSASRYSPWCASTMASGYITAPGGHRIGICGDAVFQPDAPGSFQRITSLCIRTARDYPGASDKILDTWKSILIVGAPGWGKTTLLRDLARRIANDRVVCVVDEREELYPEGIQRGRRMDVLHGFPKPQGVDMVLRTMGPDYIAVDEITAEEDCAGLIQAANCGVRLIATAHGVGMQDLKRRALYQSLLDRNIFQTFVLLKKDKSYSVERMIS
ncbi:MAG: ATPase, T2SS/T4P/T4SS family [Eubacteriales bacterium]|nr:ATPase, T2SS/T4P/T4SS family [Eubacteriales bacterium]